jgi:hypothetical protein
MAFERSNNAKHEYLDGAIYAMAGGEERFARDEQLRTGDLRPKPRSSEATARVPRSRRRCGSYVTVALLSSD